MHDGLMWTVKHDIPNWQTCADGTPYPGKDVIYLYPANPDTGENTLGSPLLAGREKTDRPQRCVRLQHAALHRAAFQDWTRSAEREPSHCSAEKPGRLYVANMSFQVFGPLDGSRATRFD